MTSDQIHDAYCKVIKIEDALYKLDYAASITVLVAEQVTDNDQSSALWAASDIIRTLLPEVENQLNDLRAQLFALKAVAIKTENKAKSTRKKTKK